MHVTDLAVSINTNLKLQSCCHYAESIEVNTILDGLRCPSSKTLLGCSVERCAEGTTLVCENFMGGLAPVAHVPIRRQRTLRSFLQCRDWRQRWAARRFSSHCYHGPQRADDRCELLGLKKVQ